MDGAQAEDWCELADLILIVAREIQFRGYPDGAAVPLTPSEGMVMRHLQVEPDTTFPQLQEATGLQRTNLSTVLRGLEAKGLAERRPRPNDRRANTVHLTERGRANYQSARTEWGSALARAAAGSPGRSELSPAIDLLQRLRHGLVRDRPRR